MMNLSACLRTMGNLPGARGNAREEGCCTRSGTGQHKTWQVALRPPQIFLISNVTPASFLCGFDHIGVSALIECTPFGRGLMNLWSYSAGLLRSIKPLPCFGTVRNEQ